MTEEGVNFIFKNPRNHKIYENSLGFVDSKETADEFRMFCKNTNLIEWTNKVSWIKSWADYIELSQAATFA